MFCYQCEQTAKGVACQTMGVCGKDPEVAALQDLLVYALKGMSMAAVKAREAGIDVTPVNAFTAEALFATLTNVNFDPEPIAEMIRDAVGKREMLKDQLKEKGVSLPDHPALSFTPEDDLHAMEEQAKDKGLEADRDMDPDSMSLMHTLLFGLKGVAAYADHAHILGFENPEIYEFIHQALSEMLEKRLSMEEWLNLVLKCGEMNYKTMELLDRANTTTYGNPVPTEVPLGHKKGKAILVSGHDLKDLEEILKQSEGKGITVYTHGEMLPCHGYPGLKKYAHFYGHYGTAWQNQRKEFAAFPGAILMTTNCIQKPKDLYHDNIFTTGLVGWPGVTHIKNRDYTPVIQKALELPGWEEDEDKGSVKVGFGHNTVLSLADKVIEAVKGKKIRHFFLVAGCDGAKPGRNYYTELVEKVPGDCVVLTLACGKFRFFDKDLGDIEGIPRLLDIGQCNDAYSAIRIASALADAFGVGVNDLPLSMILSWYEQKAVAILLTLIWLGIKDIKLGPSLPAFISGNVLGVLQKNFNIQPVTTPDQDLAELLGR